MNVGQKTDLKFKILISDRILRYRSIFRNYFELGMKLHYLYILIKKQIFEKFKITDYICMICYIIEFNDRVRDD